MRNKIIALKLTFEYIRCFPHLMLYLFHRNRQIIHADVERWSTLYSLKYRKSSALLYLLSFYPEFRNLFYSRVGSWKYFLNIICPKLSSLYIHTEIIGSGFFIQHGFSTIIVAKSIGENCWINQQVTIGYSNANEPPTIGNNVSISAGAKVVGNITIGDNVKIGANAVVMKNVPPNCTVVGIPARIVRLDGIRIDKEL